MVVGGGGLLDRFFPRGSLQRYGLAGIINTSFFGVLLVAMAALFDVDRNDAIRWATVWGVAWFLSSLEAHALHRWFTFHPSTGLAWSLSSSIPLVTLGLVGSSTTFGLLLELTDLPVWAITGPNIAAWGVVLWILNRTVVFRHLRGGVSGLAQEE